MRKEKIIAIKDYKPAVINLLKPVLMYGVHMKKSHEEMAELCLKALRDEYGWEKAEKYSISSADIPRLLERTGANAFRY